MRALGQREATEAAYKIVLYQDVGAWIPQRQGTALWEAARRGMEEKLTVRKDMVAPASRSARFALAAA